MAAFLAKASPRLEMGETDKGGAMKRRSSKAILMATLRKAKEKRLAKLAEAEKIEREKAP